MTEGLYLGENYRKDMRKGEIPEAKDSEEIEKYRHHFPDDPGIASEEDIKKYMHAICDNDYKGTGSHKDIENYFKWQKYRKHN